MGVLFVPGLSFSQSTIIYVPESPNLYDMKSLYLENLVYKRSDLDPLSICILRIF